MPDFEAHVLDRSICRQQVQELKALLDGSADLGEAVFHDFFESRLHLRALIGRYNTSLVSPDRLAWQYPLFGDFRCDFAIGDWAQKAYTFVEYEDAGPKSLFVKQGKRATRAWSSRFEDGYSQIIDWFYKLQVMTNTPDMEARFGKRSIRYTGLLLIGRDQYLRADERLRLEWRREHVIVNSKQIVCVTYDQLLEDLLFRLSPSPAATGEPETSG
ncbi:MAG TPA: Shedu immune nuclease family protein [Gemmataceae bacterium]|nr:Shedu immune nuclease family protein [Gemmataceae bacterium]